MNLDNHATVLDAVHRLIVTHVPQFRPQGALEFAATIVEQLNFEMDGELYKDAEQAEKSVRSLTNNLASQKEVLIFIANLTARAKERANEITEAVFVQGLFDIFKTVIPGEDEDLLRHYARHCTDATVKVDAVAEGDKAPRFRRALDHAKEVLTDESMVRALFKLADRDLTRYNEHAPKLREKLKEHLHTRFAKQLKDFDQAAVDQKTDEVVCKLIKDGVPIEALTAAQFGSPGDLLKMLGMAGMVH